jgi:TetR/AcrR family transcriptional repressor of bet genes
MGRPDLSAERRAELADAFARVLAKHGRSSATIAAVAAEAGVAPGLVHHYFADKQDLYAALLERLMLQFRRRTDAARSSGGDALAAYADAALALDERADVVAARAWVGLFGEALADARLFERLRRLLDAEVWHIEQRSHGALTTSDASAVLCFVVGALVFGAFAPRKTAGFAAPALRRILAALRSGVASRG